MNVAQAQTVKFTPLMASITVRGANFGPNTCICKALKACGVYYYFPERPKAFIPPEMFSREESISFSLIPTNNPRVFKEKALFR